MNKQLQDYVKIFPNFISNEICIQTVKDLKFVEWQKHGYYNSKTNETTSFDKELSVSYENISTLNTLMALTWKVLNEYIKDLKFSWFDGWAGYEQIRFNKYDKNSLMRLHCDHIHSMFDGQKKGIPILTVLGLLNTDFKGGEFLIFDNYEIKLNAGDVLVFPSNFLYPHQVKEITDGSRYSFVSWSY